MRTSFVLAVLALVSAAPASVAHAAGPLPRDVVATDVTASGFTVTWNAEPGTGTVAVFRDVLGTTPAAALIEPELVVGGDPTVADAAAALGVARVRVSGLESGRAYFFRTATTPLGGGAALLVPAPGAALPSVVTALESFAFSANGLGAPVVRAVGGALVPGALLRVRVEGTLSPLAALAGDGYSGAFATVDLANLHSAAGGLLAAAGGEAIVVEAVAGTAGRARIATTLAVNEGLGVLQVLAALAVAVPVDADGDQLPDAWEIEHGLDPGNPADAGSDSDGDGLLALDEYRLGTEPGVSDTDGDGLSDGAEVNTHHTIPTTADTDRDGRTDGQEVTGPPTSDPLDSDTDGDGVDDGTEVVAGTSPTDPGQFPVLDADGDGITDALDKCPTVPDPAQTDTDGDGTGDACDPDDDGDGVADGIDVCPRTVDVAQVDGDDDGVGDACDNCPALANTDQANHDPDGLGDACDPDSDNDGVNDFGPVPPASNAPFIVTGVTGVVDTSVPPVAGNEAFIGIAKLIPGEARLVTLAFFDVKNRTLTAVPISPNDATMPGWLALQVDTNQCDCFTLAGTETFTLATHAGNVTAFLPLGAEDLGHVFYVSADGSTFNARNVGAGILVQLLRTSQQPGPLDNCRFVPNAGQDDADADGIGDACDPSTVTTTTTSTTTTTRVRPTVTSTTIPAGKTLFLYVANTDGGFGGGKLLRYDAFTGQPRGVVKNLADATWVADRRPGVSNLALSGFLRPADANAIYASGSGLVQRFDATTGANRGINGNPLSAIIPTGAPVYSASYAQLGPFGFMYAVSPTNSVYMVAAVHPENGAFQKVLAQFGATVGGSEAPTGMLIGPDGNVYVAQNRFFGVDPGTILRFDGTTGAPLPAPGQPGALFASGFGTVGGMAFGPDGSLYFSDFTGHRVLAVDPATGTSFGTIVQPSAGGLVSPTGIAFGPDGNLYVASKATGSVLRYDWFTGEPLGAFVPKDSGGLEAPDSLLFYVADTPLPTTTTTSTTTTLASTTTTVTTTPATSTTTTTLPRCGNGVLDGGEQCETGGPACAVGNACGAPGTAGACLCIPGGAHTFQVNSTLVDADAVPGDGVCESAAGNGVCTLRAAVEETNALAGPDLIGVPAGSYPVPVGTFQNPGLTVTGDLVVTGAGAVPTIVSGGGTTRVFTVAPGATVTLRDLTVANGRRGDNVPEAASGIVNRGTLTLLDVIVRDNEGGGSASGGLGNAVGATLTLHRTVVTHNLLGDSFSAAGLSNFGTAHIFDSTFHHNAGPSIRNGANAGVLEVVRSSLFRNRGNTYSQADGGIRNDFGATATVVNSTISENIGSGIRSSGTMTIRSSTIFGNRAYAPGGGGIGVAGTATLRNTILAGNQAFLPGSNDCQGTIVSEAYNLIEDPGFCTMQGARTGEVNGPALLGPLAANGGETLTNAPLDGSVAREAGDPAVPGSGGTACETTDQRGVVRPQPIGGRCDIGAVEATPGVGLAALAETPPVHLTVDDSGTAQDVTPGDGACATATNTCTLAAAIEEANTKPGPVIVHLPAAVFTFTSGPYPDPFEGPSALPHATGDLTLVGQGAAVTKLRLEQAANQNFRLLLAYGGRLTIEGLTLGDGNSDFALDVVRAMGSPLTLRAVVVQDTRCGEGAISVGADTVLRRVTFARNTGNSRGSEGRGLSLRNGSFDAEDVLCVDNTGGGCLLLGASGPSRIVRSQFFDNVGLTLGGAVLWNSSARDPLLIEDSIFERNISSGGGALSLPGDRPAEIRRTTFRANRAGGSGGAIESGGPLLVEHSLFTDNTSTRDGGGAVYMSFNGGVRRFVDTTFVGNQSNDDGGALKITGNFVELELERTTVADSVSFLGSGGGLGIAYGAQARIANSTFTGNIAGKDGGAIYFDTGALDLANVTLAGNEAGGRGGALFALPTVLATPDVLRIRSKNSLIAGNRDGSGLAPDCGTPVGALPPHLRSFGYNLIGSPRGCTVAMEDGAPGPAPGDVLGAANGPPLDARVAPLADNGGPTPTRALTADSPAVDAANPAGCTDFNGSPLDTDQRGQPRADGNNDGTIRCDIGAFEGTTGVIPTTTTAPSTTSTTYPFFPGDPTQDPSGTTTTMTTTTVAATTSSTATTTSSSSATTSSSTTTSTVPPVGPSGIVEAFILPKRIVVRPNPKDPARSRLRAAGIFDTGPEPVDLSAAATLDVGGLSVAVPGLTRTGTRFLMSQAGFQFIIKPARTGSSKATFRMKRLGELTAIDPASALTIRFRNLAVDGIGTVRLTQGRYALRHVRGALIAPTLYLVQLRARLVGSGRDALAVQVGLATNGATPALPADLTISIGDGYTVTIPSASFTRQGDRFVAAGAAGGPPSVVLDYRRELLTVRARKVDLGTFAEGPQRLDVAVTLGNDARANRVRAVKRGKALRY